MTLQLRLSILSLLLTAGAVAVLAAGAYFLARDRVYRSVDSSLAARADAIVGALVVTDNALSQADVAQSRRSLDGQAAQGAQFRILTLEGEVLYSTTVTRSPSDEETAGVNGFRTAQLAGERTRLLVRPVLLAGQPVGWAEFWTSLTQADSSVSEVRRALTVGAICVSVFSAVFAFLVTGRAVRPVRELAQLAGEVERTSDFSKRLPATSSSTEMRTMAITFNRMIARVERMLGAQRSFLSDTSHELRRPLTVLRTDLDVLNDPGLSDVERRAVVCEMQEVAASMSHLLSELLLLSRRDEATLQLGPTDLSDLCLKRLQAISLSHPVHTYEQKLDPEVWVNADRDWLSRAVDNLLQNAAIYTPAGGKIEVELIRSDDSASLRIADSGPGMGEDEVARAFDRFYRGPGSRRTRPDGLGLGLAIVKQTVDHHGGSVRIESELGKGTAVTVVLPLTKP